MRCALKYCRVCYHKLFKVSLDTIGLFTMHFYFPVLCKNTHHTDMGSMCDGYASEGWCRSNPGWMLTNCHLSCVVCPLSPSLSSSSSSSLSSSLSQTSKTPALSTQRPYNTTSTSAKSTCKSTLVRCR